jgi:hypothetical protein
MKITGMNTLAITALLGASLALAACETGDEMMKKPVNCSTASQDIAALEKEKANSLREMSAGAQTILPPAVIVGLLQGKYEQNTRIAGGQYNKDIDAKIAEIKSTCKK